VPSISSHVPCGKGGTVAPRLLLTSWERPPTPRAL
jgi:hypothetical protein